MINFMWPYSIAGGSAGKLTRYMRFKNLAIAVELVRESNFCEKIIQSLNAHACIKGKYNNITIYGFKFAGCEVIQISVVMQSSKYMASVTYYINSTIGGGKGRGLGG